MTPELLKDFLLFLAGTVVASLGYLLKRIIERRADHEALDIDLKVLSVRKALSEQQIGPGDLHQLKEVLLEKRSNKSTDVSVVEPLLARIDSEPVTQAEMNQIAFREYEKVAFALTEVLKELSAKLDKDRRRELEETHRAWVTFRDKQAAFSADEYKGGSIQPLIHAVELTSLTHKRTQELLRLYKALLDR